MGNNCEAGRSVRKLQALRKVSSAHRFSNVLKAFSAACCWKMDSMGLKHHGDFN